MTPERWQQVNELFKAALERAPEERVAFLNQACAGDESLCSDVESLIDSYEQEESFLETPAVAAAAHSLLNDQAEQLVGQALGHYRIVTLLGEGGMGEVYLALDERLGRRVAIKLLPGAFVRDESRLRRFEQEGRAASALDHPNVCMIHEVGETDDGRHFIVMEYVEGETLRRRMAGGWIGLTQALDVAMQVGSGLAAAHAGGVVHRDVKPENIMLRGDGYVKVLDFGLAKIGGQAATGVAARIRTRVKTETGMVLGTSRYMSPEQARGLAVDPRTDVWSLGVVLYEMAAGCVPFEGETNSDVIASILERPPPPLSDYLPEAPVELQRLVTKALSKAREERYQTINELLLDLKNLKQQLESGVKLERARKRRIRSGHQSRRAVDGRASTTKRLIWSAALALMVGIGGGAWIYFSRPALKLSPPVKYVSFTSFPGWEGNPAFSPDGNQIAFDWSGEKNDNSDIYVMPIGSAKPLRLTTDPASDYGPTWSPDGRQIAFVRASESEIAIYAVPASGGAERKLLSLDPEANLGNWGLGHTLDWSPDGKYIAYVEQKSKHDPPSIFLFSPETGEKRTLTSPVVQDFGDVFPVFSPDSRTVAFNRSTSALSADIYLVSVTGGEPKRLTFDNVPISRLAWTADGREIVFSSTRAGGDFSLWRISASGGAPERSTVGGHYVPGVATSRQGNRLAYVQWSGDYNIYRIEVSDSTGSNNLPIKLTSSTRLDYAPQYSPDGRRIVFQSDRSGSQEIWVCDSDGSNFVQVTSLGEWAGTPRWSPDGRQIAFDLHAEGKGDIYVISASGGLPRSIVTGDSEDIVPSWSRDGKWIYFASNRTGDCQVWKVPAEGGEAVQVTRRGGGLAFESPDGMYVYYGKDSTPGIWRVPMDGGEEIQVLDSFKSEFFGDWAVVRDGLYFINPDTKDGVAIQFFAFATRKVKQVATLGKVDILPYGISVSPDRRYVLYAQNDQSGGDIMLVENFR